ncbi:MAG TPA: hypothetical protein DDW50_18030 [Firmicutes bacterium]|jgi:hypothetical protein|nr:hypothetical protein [Bacillota bacterium]
MKKLIVLFLVVVFTLSVAITASASTFNPFCGGRIVWSYIDSDAKNSTDNNNEDWKDNPVSLNHGGLKLLLRESLSDDATGTWANIGFRADGWPNEKYQSDDGTVNKGTAPLNGNSINTTTIYDFGWKKIGGSHFNLWYSNWESETTNIGQGRIYEVYPTQFNEDPMFDRDASHCIDLDYIDDNLQVSYIYEPNKNDVDKNNNYFAVIYKFDGGDAHAGYYNGQTGYTKSGASSDTQFNSSEYIVGTKFKAGPISAQVDYLNMDMKEDVDGNDCPWDKGSIASADISYDPAKFDVTLISDDKYHFHTNGGYGYQARYSGFCDGKLSLVYKTMVADKDIDATGIRGHLETGNFSTAYIGYKYGIFETRLGWGNHGKDDGKDDYVFASVYANFW